MRYIIVIFSIFLFSLNVISCGIMDSAKSSDESSASSSSDESAGTYQLATHDYANGVVTDSYGNFYVAGVTYGGLDGNSS